MIYIIGSIVWIITELWYFLLEGFLRCLYVIFTFDVSKEQFED